MSIQVYGTSYVFEDGSGVYITGVDVGQVVAEFEVNDVLEVLPFEDVASFVERNNNGRDDE